MVENRFVWCRTVSEFNDTILQMGKEGFRFIGFQNGVKV